MLLVRTCAALACLLPAAATDQSTYSARHCHQQVWSTRAAEVQAACCVGGHRRAQLLGKAEAPGSCELPTTCPSANCAATFVRFYAECATLIASAEAQDPRKAHRYDDLLRSCQAMAPPGAISTAVAVRKGPDACAFKIVCLDAHDTQGCRVACDDDAPAAADGHCDALLSMADTSAAQMKARMAESEVVLFSTRNDEGGARASNLLYTASVCNRVEILDADEDAYLACLHPHEEFLGNKVHSYVFAGGKFLSNGLALTGIDGRTFDQRMDKVGATRACGKALEPPPPPPGEVDACYRKGSTQIFEADAAVAPTCKTQKEALPATCDSAADVPAWREFMSCAFSANGWGKYRSGGNGGCSGPTTMAFCEAEFAGDPDRIRCCSNSRCPWSASLFGDNGGNAACLTDDWAVNICCQPCTCWLSPQGSLVGGNANMTIAEDDGRGYPVILNSDGFAVAVPFRCGSTGLFGNPRVMQVREWQTQQGQCGHDPMGGGDLYGRRLEELPDGGW